MKKNILIIAAMLLGAAAASAQEIAYMQAPKLYREQIKWDVNAGYDLSSFSSVSDAKYGSGLSVGARATYTSGSAGWFYMNGALKADDN